jgi:predicted MPP superfamily phosphohydrolase
VHPAIPAALNGLRILHLADSHITRVLPRPSHHRQLLRALEQVQADLVVLTGDCMNHPGDELAALRALDELSHSWRSRFGALAIPGNHDTAAFVREARRLPNLRWLDQESVDYEFDLGKGRALLRVVGSGFPENLMLAASRIAGAPAPCRTPSHAACPSAPKPDFTLALTHYPTEVFVAAQLGLPLLLAGHTHGGQIRPHSAFAPHTSCDLPAHQAGGIFQLRETMLCISRGLGRAVLPIRLNCPAQAPLYTLAHGNLRNASCEALTPLLHW